MRFTVFLGLFVFFATSILSQNQLYLEGNSARVTLNDNGIFFSDVLHSVPGYEIPKDSGNHVAYITTFYFAGIESDSTVHVSRNRAPTLIDMFPGPIADNYGSGYYTSTFDTSIWRVTRDQINFHVGNYTASGYIPDPSIALWPGNGNPGEGVSAQLAPYVDVDQDEVYNPMAGDFPYIQGDEAVFVLMNDESGTRTATTGPKLGIEIHAMFYQFHAAGAIDNTTFLNVTVFNRRDTSYTDFLFGVFLDADIGKYNDDYAGSDSARSLGYAYNGDVFDEGGFGQPGYGSNPPAFGVQFLNAPAGSFISFLNSSTSWGNPGEIYFSMLALDASGSPLTYSGAPYNFMFSGDPYTGTGWTEYSLADAPGDRRMILSSKGQALSSGSSLCYDMAFIFTREAGNAWGNVEELLNVSDVVSDFYNNDIQPCNQIFLGKPEFANLPDFKIYPNPSSGNFTVVCNEPVFISVYDLSGKNVISEFQIISSTEISTDLQPGVYLVRFRSGETVSGLRIIVEP